MYLSLTLFEHQYLTCYDSFAFQIYITYDIHYDLVNHVKFLFIDITFQMKYNFILYLQDFKECIKENLKRPSKTFV